MPKGLVMASPNSPNDLTRQQLDELDTLLQRMLALPLNKPDTVPAPVLAELPLPPPSSGPEPTNWSPPPEFPRPARPSFLTLTPAPEPADDFAPRPSEHRLMADLLPFPIPTDPPPPGGPGTLRGVDAPATPAGFVSAFAAFNDPAADPLAPISAPEFPAPPPAATTPPPAASGIGLFTPVALANRVIEGILDWCGPLGYWLTRPAVKRLLGYAGLVLLTGAIWWTARGLGWVSWPE